MQSSKYLKTSLRSSSAAIVPRLCRQFTAGTQLSGRANGNKSSPQQANPQTKVADDPGGKRPANKAASDLVEGATASLHATPGENNAKDFGKKGLSEEEKGKRARGKDD